MNWAAGSHCTRRSKLAWAVGGGLVALLLLARFGQSDEAVTAAQAAGEQSVEPPAQAAQPPGQSAEARSQAVRELTAHIDAYFDAAWKQAGAEPSPAARDAEFLRRLHLDLCGRIPLPMEVADFLADVSASKWRQQISALLERGSFAGHWATVWRHWLLASGADKPAVRFYAPQFEAWLRNRFAAEVPYNQLVSELLRDQPADLLFRRRARANAEPSPLAFLFHADSPAQLAAETSRVFLGLQVACAECHDHPFEHWKRLEFWSFAAAFHEPDGNGFMMLADQDGMDANRPPVFLDGTAPPAGSSRRAALADWLVADANPWFAAAAVNRVWAQLLGRGLVDPFDNIEARDPNGHRQLLDDIAAAFRSQHYDLTFIIEAVVNTRVYQLASCRPAGGASPAPHLFACMHVRKMSAEQLYDSLMQAGGMLDTANPGGQRNAAAPSARDDFLAKFEETNEAAADAETTIPHALALMNGRVVADATAVERCPTLHALVSAPFLTPADRVELLFLATLSRAPTSGERERLVAYLATAANDGQAAAAADVFWALLNSVEFSLVP